MKESAASEPEPHQILLVMTRNLTGAAFLARHLKGHRTLLAQSMTQASEIAQRLLPQAIMIDSAAEPLTYTELQNLAQTWAVSPSTFIACTLPGEELLRRQLRVDGFLIKPISIQNLRVVLHQFTHNFERILVIDDDQDFVRLLTRMLNSPVNRYQRVSTYSGQEELALLKLHKPDLIFLDLHLPDIDGVDVLEKIRAYTEHRKTSVIIISGQDSLDGTETVEQPMMIAKTGGFTAGTMSKLLQSLL
jgi:CheY-like chemotaxis protein